MTQPIDYQKRAFVIILVLLGLVFLLLIRPVFMPVMLGAILVILLYPVYSFLLKILRGKSYIASFFATFLVFVVLVLPTGLVIALLVNQAIDLVGQLNLKEQLDRLVSHGGYQKFVQPLVVEVQNKLKFQIDVAGLVTRATRQALHYIYNFSPQVLSHTAGFIFSFFVMHFSIFFLFIEGKKVIQTILDLSPIDSKYEDRLSGEIKNMIYATVNGYLVTSLVQAALAGVGFAIAGIPAPLVFAALTFFMSLVPIVGATSVWLPIALWLFFQDKIGTGIFLSIYGFLVISGIDNFIKPMIIQGKAKIHPLIIFFALFGGIKLFGPIGILFGPVLTALFFACIRIYKEDFLKPEGEK